MAMAWSSTDSISASTSGETAAGEVVVHPSNGKTQPSNTPGQVRRQALTAGRLIARSAMFRQLVEYTTASATDPHRLGEPMNDRSAVIPADAGIRDALTVGQRLVGNHVLSPGDQMTLDRRADNAGIPTGNLAGDILGHLDLPGVLLLAVGVREVDHQPLGHLGLAKLLEGLADTGGIVVR